MQKGLVELGLILLAEACPGMPMQALADLPVGRRDALIFRLRESVFGSRIVGVSTCPACRMEMELTASISDILQRQNESDGNCRLVMTLDHQGYKVNFRLPCTRDLMAAADGLDIDKAYHCLIQRCVIDAFSKNDRIEPGDLPDQVVDIMADMMSEADPVGDVQMSLTCSSCGHRWHQTFDIIWFFGKEIDSWAHRTLRDVNDLASAYGWSESEILSMSPKRRQSYIEIINFGKGGR